MSQSDDFSLFLLLFLAYEICSFLHFMLYMINATLIHFAIITAKMTNLTTSLQNFCICVCLYTFDVR